MIIPKFLAPGDKVGIVATAKKLDKSNTLKGIAILEHWGLTVVCGKHIFNSHNQFAGTDAQRAEDLQNMINNHEIKAIFMARGGYGSTRIIDKINFDPLRDHPKWIFGFSDITAFHLHLYNLDIASFHAPMPSFFHTLNSQSLDWMKKSVFGNKEKLTIKSNSLNKLGEARGILIGGNLSIICHTIGTSTEIKTKGNILFIEDIGEQLYHLDRMMVQMKRAGFLDDLAGMIVGQFSDMEDNEERFGLNANEIIKSHLSGFDYPVAFDFPIGHTQANYALPVGVPSKMTVNESSVGLVLEL